MKDISNIKIGGVIRNHQTAAGIGGN